MCLSVQVITAVAAIEFSTRYSKACCKLMVDSSGVSALLAFMRSCNRSKPHVEMLGHALACLANICRCGLKSVPQLLHYCNYFHLGIDRAWLAKVQQVHTELAPLRLGGGPTSQS